ncbi:MAG: hypothetical protein Q7R32_09285 [Dehalococcoidia bacterium]|nr:hypothetical protein [Dehalococcoidia bacterium]
MAASGLANGWADRYRDKWKWDKVVWGSHSVDCYPGGCPFRVYVRHGKVVREEQSGTLTPVQDGVPDMNPMGCQKGACWSYLHYTPEPVTQPLKPVRPAGDPVQRLRVLSTPGVVQPGGRGAGGGESGCNGRRATGT